MNHFRVGQKLKTNPPKIRFCNIIAFGFRSLSSKASIQTLQPRRWCCLLELRPASGRLGVQIPDATGQVVTAQMINARITLRPNRIPYFNPTPRRCYSLPRYTITVKSSRWSRGHDFTVTVWASVVYWKWSQRHRMHSYKCKNHVQQNLFFLPLSRAQNS